MGAPQDEKNDEKSAAPKSLKDVMTQEEIESLAKNFGVTADELIEAVNAKDSSLRESKEAIQASVEAMHDSISAGNNLVLYAPTEAQIQELADFVQMSVEELKAVLKNTFETPKALAGSEPGPQPLRRLEGNLRDLYESGPEEEMGEKDSDGVKDIDSYMSDGSMSDSHRPEEEMDEKDINGSPEFEEENLKHTDEFARGMNDIDNVRASKFEEENLKDTDDFVIDRDPNEKAVMSKEMTEGLDETTSTKITVAEAKEMLLDGLKNDEKQAVEAIRDSFGKSEPKIPHGYVPATESKALRTANEDNIAERLEAAVKAMKPVPEGAAESQETGVDAKSAGKAQSGALGKD